MTKTIKAFVSGSEALTRFWAQYFPETPMCALPECDCVACEVDSYFPYLDDLNRCEQHPLELMEPLRRSARGCTARYRAPESGTGCVASGLSLAMKHRRRGLR